ncbi:DUF5079 domain-containing protein [Mammaliicoccus vitulinus]|uniref:DUF5079 domain-containing protein n=2 Tax=Mammaliicoccus vitulinus TaxID=71237 RepID=A0A2T4PQ94_9STAP|nr:DUF5079 family protein [Mammaliicoccus vitulinus]PTI27703.1 DUF5079 domain-containing protein [Mammaliicoccus vitulinus]
MDINSEIDELRKPVAQLLSLFALFMVFFACLTFFNGLDYDKLPFYLKGITIIELIIIAISLLQFIRFIKFDNNDLVNKRKLKNYAKFLTIINVVATYNAMFAFSNVFYFMAIQNNVDLYGYWLLYVVTMVISFALWSLGSILVWIELPRLQKYISGKTKSFIGLGLLLVSQFIYIEKIIEYILVPDIAESKFAIAVSIIMLLGNFAVAIEWVRRYANFKIHVLKE